MNNGNTAVAITAPPVPSRFVLPEILYVPREEIRAFVGQPRTYFDPAKLDLLATSMDEDGQLTPALAIRLEPPIGKHKYELVDGERRWQGAEIKNIPHFLILIDPRIKTKDDQYVKSVMSNFFREPTTDVETARSIDRMMKMGMPKEIICKKMGKSITWVYQHHSLLRLHPDVLKLLEPPTPEKKRVPYLTALSLVDLPQADQLELAGKISEERISRLKTKHLIRQVAEAKGLTHVLKLPRKAFTGLRTLVRKSNEGVEEILSEPAKFFEKVLHGGKPEEMDKLLEGLDEVVSGFSQIKEVIEKEMKKK